MVVLVEKWLYLDKLFLFEKNGCIRAKRVVFGELSFVPAKWLYSGSLVVFRQCGFIRAKIIVFGRKWLYSGQSGCVPAKVLVFGQGG